MKRSTSLRIPDSPKVTSSYPGTPRTASSTPEKSDKQLNVCTLPILKYGLRSPIALPSEDTADDLHKSISTEIETLNPLESKETIISTLKKNHSDTAITKKRAYLISQDNSALNIFFGNNHPEIEIKHNLKEDRIWCAGSMIACQDNALIITDQSGRFPHSDLSKLEKLLGQLVGKFSIAYIPFQDYAPSVCTAKVPQFMKLLHIMKGGIATFKELLHPDSPLHHDPPFKQYLSYTKVDDLAKKNAMVLETDTGIKLLAAIIDRLSTLKETDINDEFCDMFFKKNWAEQLIKPINIVLKSLKKK